MKISRHHDGDTVRISLQGDLDLATNAAVRGCVDQALAESGPERLLIDMTGVTFCDSAGIEALLYARTVSLERGTTFRVANVGGISLVALEMTGVLPLLSGDVGVGGG